ncbi:MAG: hypothetical protein LBH93_08150, partial [Chitinispirillales bacterium]|nr:hypothetical protein [Chitinispirillales bacterium]
MGALLRAGVLFMARPLRLASALNAPPIGVAARAAAITAIVAAALSAAPAAGADADTESAIESPKKGSPQEARAPL